MTTETQKTSRTRLANRTLELTNQKQKLSALLAERIGLAGTVDGELRRSLLASPEYVIAECQVPTVDARYYTPAGNIRAYKSSEVPAPVMALTDEIRSTLLRVARLSEELQTKEP